MKKIANFIKTFKSRKVKLLKTNPLKLKNHAVTFLSERGKGFLALENGRISKTDKKLWETLKKIADFN